MEDTVEMMTGPGYMGVDMEAKDCQEESVVVVVSRNEDPHHHGGVLTPVHGPTTIPENGVEGGHVLGLHATEGHTEDEDNTLGIKYCPGIKVTLPRYTYQEHKPHCSRIWPNRIIFETQGSNMTHTQPLGPMVSSDTLGNVGTAHTPPPRPAKKQAWRGHIEQSTVVQCSAQTADLRAGHIGGNQ
jgi:hypothetical protein